MKRQFSLQLTALACLICLSAAPQALFGESAADLVGHWEGQIQAPDQESAISVDIDRDADGGWTGRLDIPAQSLYDLTLKDIAIDGKNVRFAIAVPGDSPSFSGTLAKRGVLAGDYVQAGKTAPFRLERKSEAPQAPAASDNAAEVEEWVGGGVAGEGFAGEWRGALLVQGNALRVEFKLEEADGVYSGVASSIDQGAFGLILEEISAEGDSLTFAIPAINGSYSAQLNEDGSAMAGTWSQGEVSVEMVVKRYVVE